MQNHSRRFDESGGIILELTKSDLLLPDIKDKYLYLVTKNSIVEDRFDIAINLWGKFEPILTFYQDELKKAIVVSMEDNARLFEYKLFFVKKLFNDMSHQ